MNWFWANVVLWLTWAAYWFISARFAARAKRSESWLARLSHLLPLTIAFVLVFHYFHPPLWYGDLALNRSWRAFGTALTAIGLLFTVWARIHLGRNWSAMVTLKQGHELIRTGPYRCVRHPIYSGLLLAFLGSAITASTGDALVGFAILIITVVVKLRREEEFLTAEFGESYRQFQSEVSMIVPYIL